MSIYYSPSQSGFYTEEIHGSRTIRIIDPNYVPDPENPNEIPLTVLIDNPACKIPLDAIAITFEYYEQLFADQSQGAKIMLGEDGLPVAEFPLDETEVEARARILDQIRLVRIPMLGALAGIAGMESRRGNTTIAQAADDTSQALIEITEYPAFLSATTYEDMHTAIFERYQQIVEATPAEVQVVFREVFGLV